MYVRSARRASARGETARQSQRHHHPTAETIGVPREEDKQFGEAAFRLNLVTRQQLDDLYAQLDKQSEGGTFARLNDLMVERGLITEAQRQEVEKAEGSQKAARQIGGFEIERKIGQGGMASVYRARQLSMDRPVALKILHSKYTRKKHYIERFFHEARASAKLSHVNIVQGIDVGQSDGFYYFAMEYIDGETLKERLDREGIIPENEGVDIVLAVARALDYANRQAGIIHRDIKPGNILITRDGVPKVCDLGLAKTMEAETGDKRTAPMGTPHYMSPEQVRGLPDIDTRADIYSLGATFYHMVTGTTPYEGNKAQELMKKHVTLFIDPPETRNSNLSPGACYVISKMIAKRRKERYQTMAEVAEDLERLAAGQPPAGMAPSGPWAKLPKLDTKVLVTTAGLAAAAVILALVISQIVGGDGPKPDDEEPGGLPPDGDETIVQSEAEAVYLAAIDYGMRNPHDISGRMTRLEEVVEQHPESPEAGYARSDIERLARRAEALRRRADWEATHRAALATVDEARQPYPIPADEQPLRMPADLDDGGGEPDNGDDDPDPGNNDDEVDDNGDDNGDDDTQPPPPVDPVAALRNKLDVAAVNWYERMIVRDYDKATAVLDNALPADLPEELTHYRGLFDGYRQLTGAMKSLWSAVRSGARADTQVLFDGRVWTVKTLDGDAGILTLAAEGDDRNVDIHKAPLGLVMGLVPSDRVDPRNTALMYFFDNQFPQARNILAAIDERGLLKRLEEELPRLKKAHLNLNGGGGGKVEPTGRGDEAEARELYTMLLNALEAPEPMQAAVYRFSDTLLTRYGNNDIVQENLEFLRTRRNHAIRALKDSGQWESIQQADQRPMVVVNPAAADGETVFATVAEAVDAAEEGGLVEIVGGAYTENLEIFDKTDVVIRPREGDWVVLQGAPDKPAVSTLYARGCKRLVVRDIVITGPGFLVNIENSDGCTLESCWIVNSRRPKEEAGVEFRRSQGCRLVNCIVQGFTRGMNIERSRICLVRGNLFLNTPHAAVEIIGSAQCKILGNVIQDTNAAWLTDAANYKANTIDQNVYRNAKHILKDLVKVYARTLEEARNIGGTKNDMQSADNVVVRFKEPEKGDYRIVNPGDISRATGLNTPRGPRWNDVRWWLATKHAPVAKD
jgi:serine/threonine-protein kinase